MDIKVMAWNLEFTNDQQKRAAALGVALPSGQRAVLDIPDTFANEVKGAVQDLIKEMCEDTLGERCRETYDSYNGDGAFDAVVETACKVSISPFGTMGQSQTLRRLALAEAAARLPKEETFDPQEVMEKGKKAAAGSGSTTLTTL